MGHRLAKSKWRMISGADKLSVMFLSLTSHPTWAESFLVRKQLLACLLFVITFCFHKELNCRNLSGIAHSKKPTWLSTKLVAGDYKILIQIAHVFPCGETERFWWFLAVTAKYLSSVNRLKWKLNTTFWTSKEYYYSAGVRLEAKCFVLIERIRVSRLPFQGIIGKNHK